MLQQNKLDRRFRYPQSEGAEKQRIAADFLKKQKKMKHKRNTKIKN